MAATPRHSKPTVLSLDGDNTHLANLCGPLDENLKQIADGWGVTISRRGNRFTVNGRHAKAAAKALQWFHEHAVHQALSVGDIQLGLVELGANTTTAEQGNEPEPLPPVGDASVNLRTPGADVRPRTPRQRHYLNQ